MRNRNSNAGMDAFQFQIKNYKFWIIIDYILSITGIGNDPYAERAYKDVSTLLSFYSCIRSNKR